MFNKIVDSVKRSVPFLGGKKRPAPKQVLSLKPLRNPRLKWTRSPDTDLVVVIIERPAYKAWDKMIGRVFQIPTDRKVEMSDELSSKVWEMCDGTNTVSAIATYIGHQYKLTQRQAEVSVLAFLNTLQSKRLVGITPDQAKQMNSGDKPTGTQRPRGGKAVANVSKGRKGFYASRKRRTNSDVA